MGDLEARSAQTADARGVIAALEHLATRLPALAAMESRNRHWTHADLEAVAVLAARPATREQLALARIEGIVATKGGYDTQADRRILSIARRALGLASA